MSDRKLTAEEEEILEWLSNQRENGRGSILWTEFEEKVEEVTGANSVDKIDDSIFSFNLYGVTVTIEEGNKMYPIRDLEQGIVRGYSTD